MNFVDDRRRKETIEIYKKIIVCETPNFRQGKLLIACIND